MHPVYQPVDNAGNQEEPVLNNDSKAFEAVLFDMDGVLVDSEELIALAAQMMFKAKYSVEMPRDAFLPYVGAGEDRYLGGPAAERGIEIDVPSAKALTYEYYGQLASTHIRVLAGAREYLSACKESGMKIALASAADKTKVLINLKVLGVEEGFFDAFVTGSEVEHKKPSPDIYLLAARKTGVQVERCLVVEDAVNGIIAGIRAGCRCLGITSSFSESELKAAGALWCAKDLASAPKPWELTTSIAL